MIISGGVLYMPQVISSFILKGDLSGMWLIWSGVMGAASGKAFFAHLWSRLPVKTENELILYRFSGKGAKVLHVFRSLYVGGIIVPIVLSFSFLAFSRVASFVFDISFTSGLIISTGIVLTGTLFNSLKNRLKLDFIFLIIFLLSFLAILFFLFNNYGNIMDLNTKVNDSNLGFRIFPLKGSTAFAGFLVFILVQWWSALIVDFPDINGQKLMSAKNVNEISKSIILPNILFFVFNLLLYTLPVFVLFVPEIEPGISGEMAFFSIFKEAVPERFRFLIFIFFLIPFLSVVNNAQNWGGSLLVQNFYKYHIKKNASEKHLNKIGLIVMILLGISAFVITFYNDSLVNIIKFLLSITAGVGPVFILRWYWHRINAWSQFSAMLSSLIYPFVYDYAYNHIDSFQQTLDFFMQDLNMGYYPLKILVLTFLVCSTWLIVTFMTKPTNLETTKRFAETVKPGGIWGKSVKKGQVYFWKRAIIWLILSTKSAIFYMLFWKLVTGNYWLALLFSILYILLLLIAYKRLLKVNADYAET